MLGVMVCWVFLCDVKIMYNVNFGLVNKYYKIKCKVYVLKFCRFLK